MINSSRQTLHHAFHLEREHRGGKRADRHVEGGRQRVELLVVAVFERVDNPLLVIGKLGEERTLDTLAARGDKLRIGLPSHCAHEVVGRAYERGLGVADTGRGQEDGSAHRAGTEG